MPLISDSIPNLIQGISQQPDSLRNVTQLEAQEDCYSSTVEGLIRRPPIEHIGIVSTTPLDTAFMHTINRSADQRYKMIITNGGIQVFDLTGTAKTIDFVDEDLVILDAATSSANGDTYTIAAAPGETSINVTVSGIETTTLVDFQGSIDGVDWVSLVSTAVNGTFVVTIGDYLFMRAVPSVYTVGSITVMVTYKNLRYLVTQNEIFTVFDHQTSNVSSNTVPLTVAPGESYMRFAVTGNVAATVTLDGSVDGSNWDNNIASFVSANGTTQVAIGDYIFVRGHITDYVSGSISASVALRSSTTTAKAAMRAMTVADFTFIVNTEKVPAMESNNSISRPYEGLISVKQGNYGAWYNVFVNGINSANTLTSETVASTTSTTAIANQLYAELHNNALLAAYTITLVGSVIHVSNANTDFVLRVDNPHGSTDIQIFKDITQTFAELPTEAPDGFRIAIDADLTTDQGKFFVEAVTNQAGDTFGPVTWQETLDQGIPYRIDASTMPYALVRNADDTFSYGQIDWVDRLVGTDISNPDPSFIGTPINDLSFFKNRLGFFADENFIFSEIGEYFNFFRTTMTQIKDSDMVDARATHTKVSILKRVVPFNRNLLMFSDLTQFMIPSDAAMTPKTVRADVVSEYESSLDASPINAGKVIYYMFHREDYEGMSELSLSDTVQDVYEATDISAHVPAYIPAGASSLSISTLAGVTAILTAGDPGSVYIYKTEWIKDKKVQQAWCRWNLGQYSDTVTMVLSADFIGNTLYLLVQRNGQVFLEKVQLIPNRVDPFATYVTFLDRRITESELATAPVYTASNNSTSLTLPYAITSSNTLVVTRNSANNDAYMDPGRSLTILSAPIGSTVIRVRGNANSNPLYIGQRFLSEAELSTIYIRKQSLAGGIIIDSASKLQLLKGSLVYSSSGPFTVRVIPEGRANSNYVFTGRLVGDINNVLGDLTLPSGRFNFSILSNNERVRILLRNDSFLPFHLTSLDWEGTYTRRSSNR